MTPAFKKHIETHFSAGMRKQFGPQFPLFYSNVPVPDSVETFAVVQILASDRAFPINLGITSKTRNVGIVQIDSFTPKDIGSGTGGRLAFVGARLFHREKFVVNEDNGLATLRDASIRDMGAVRGWHRHATSIPYQYDFDLHESAL